MNDRPRDGAGCRRVLAAALAAAILAGCSKPGPITTPDNRARLDAFLQQASDGRPQEGTYLGADGRPLGFIAYRATAGPAGTALVYVHGIESHAGWFDGAARLLQRGGHDVFCLDRRGSGINRENRGFASGHVESLAQLLGDADAFIRAVTDRYERVVAIGLSWGGKLVLGYALAHPDPLDGMILITPGIRTLVDVPLSTKIKIVVSSTLRPTTGFRTPIEPDMFTTTPRHLRYIIDDPLRLETATARFFTVSRALDAYIDANMAANRLPIALFLAGRDRIVDNDGVTEVLRRGAQDRLDTIRYPEQTHSIQLDAPARLVADMTRWLDALPAASPEATASP